MASNPSLKSLIDEWCNRRNVAYVKEVQAKLTGITIEYEKAHLDRLAIEKEYERLVAIDNETKQD